MRPKYLKMSVRDKIVEGSFNLFIRFGIRSITMDMIAEQLGISKRTIYENFKDKDELLKHCLESAITMQKKIHQEILDNSENVIDAMLIILKQNNAIIKSVNPLFFHDMRKYYKEIDKDTLECENKEKLSQFSELLRRGIREKLFRDCINVEIVSILFFEQFHMLIEKDFFPEEKFPKAEVFDNIVINFMRGIATEKGIRIIEKYSK